MELFRALGALAERPSPQQHSLVDVLDLPDEPDSAQYADVFLFQLYPYASVYLGPEGMLGGEAGDRIAGFWRALGLTPPSESDHLAALLGLYATLVENEAGEPPGVAQQTLWRQSRKALLWEHLASWLFPYIEKLIEIAPPCYLAWGDLLQKALLSEIQILGLADALPLHLREAPSLPDPREVMLEDFLQALLCPVRSGVVLVRTDLKRAADDLGLGFRIGERKFVLRSLFSQDSSRTLEWLRREAVSQRLKHLRYQESLGVVARFWAGRAEITATVLAELQASEHGLSWVG